MKKLSLLALVVLALLFQNCKKSTPVTPTTPSPLLTATVNGGVWTPDTLSAIITYNAATKTKTLAINGTKTQKRVEMVYVQSSTDNTNNFTLGTYTVDATGNPSMIYSTQQLVTSGYAFVPVGKADVSSGSIEVSAIDPVNKTITGTFNFTLRKANYDTNGQIISVDVSSIAGGSFNAMPYTFVSN